MIRRRAHDPQPSETIQRPYKHLDGAHHYRTVPTQAGGIVIRDQGLSMNCDRDYLVHSRRSARPTCLALRDEACTVEKCGWCHF